MKVRTSPTSRPSRYFPKSLCKPIEPLEVDRVTADVTESDVDAMIERLRKQQMKYTAVTRAAATGDKVTVDFEGAIDGVAFAGGKGESMAIVLGEGRMLPQLEQGLDRRRRGRGNARSAWIFRPIIAPRISPASMPISRSM